MRRLQTFHETLIPMLVWMSGAKSYLELGTYHNDTLAHVRCEKRYGVDTNPVPLAGVEMFAMSTRVFIRDCAALLAPIDFVFIDADHNAESAFSDFIGIYHHVSDEGLVVLHDTNPDTRMDTDPGLCGDSWKTARKLHELGYECVTLNFHPGLTIVRNRVKWGPK